MNKISWVILVTILLIFIFLFIKIDKISLPISWGNEIKIIKDTVYIERYYAADTILITKPKIVYRTRLDTLKIFQRDTIIEITNTEGFIATDSLITKKQDTFKVSFIYPENYFRYTINYSPDTIKQIKLNFEKKEKDWVKYLEFGVIGLGAGIVIRSMFK